MKAIIGNEKAQKILSDSLKNETFSHAYLFSGPVSVGKTTFAVEMARTLLCKLEAKEECDCPSCHLVASMSHPDLHFLSSTGAGVEEVREITRQLAMMPYQSKYRVAVITHVQDLTVQALNSFLKTLEEPKDNTVIIMTTENKATLLPTIVSRTRQVNFGPVSDKVVFEYLNQELGVKKERAKDLSIVAAGRVGMAVGLSETEVDANAQIREGENFLRVFRSDSIVDKLFLAAKLASVKEGLRDQIPAISATIRRILLATELQKKESELTDIVSALDALAAGDELLRKNINPKLVFESVLLRSI